MVIVSAHRQHKRERDTHPQGRQRSLVRPTTSRKREVGDVDRQGHCSKGTRSEVNSKELFWGELTRSQGCCWADRPTRALAKAQPRPKALDLQPRRPPTEILPDNLVSENDGLVGYEGRDGQGRRRRRFVPRCWALVDRSPPLLLARRPPPGLLERERDRVRSCRRGASLD